ncbi:MAG: hypothetical protein ABI947_07745 [Chloroflexota bacterium]
MFKRLMPVSDFQRVVRFDDYDLAANRAGVLSVRQRWNFVALRLVEHLLGLLTVCFIGMWIIDTLHYLPFIHYVPDPGLIGMAFVVVLILTAVLYGLHVRPAFSKSVESIKGKLIKRDLVAPNVLPLAELMISSIPFYVHYSVFGVLEEGAIYQAYYLKRSKRIGGNQLLSLELLEPAPPNDEYDFE